MPVNHAWRLPVNQWTPTAPPLGLKRGPIRTKWPKFFFGPVPWILRKGESLSFDEDSVEVHFEALRIWRKAKPIRFTNPARLYEAVKIFVERKRMRITRTFEQTLDFFELTLQDKIPDRGVRVEDLVRWDSSATFQRWNELLANDSAKRAGNLTTCLELLLRRKEFKKAGE